MVVPRLKSPLLINWRKLHHSLSIVRSKKSGERPSIHPSFPAKIAPHEEKIPSISVEQGSRNARGWRMLLARPLYDHHLVVK